MLDKDKVLLTGETEMGLVQVFTGNGKGKTTAALGTVIRSLGHGLRVCIIFFMKTDHDYGEYNTLSRLDNVDISSYGTRKLIDPANIRPEEKEQAEKGLEAARRAILSGDYDLVVLDEVNVAASFGLIEADEVIKLIEDKPPDVELILTGRGADDRIVGMADLVTEMVEVKHPFNMGIKARKGIEY